MTLTVYHNILRFEISIDDQVVVQVLESADDLSCVKLHIIFHLELVSPDPIDEVTASD